MRQIQGLDPARLSAGVPAGSGSAPARAPCARGSAHPAPAAGETEARERLSRNKPQDEAVAELGRALSSCQSHTFHQDPHIHPTASGLTYLVIYSAFKIKSHHAERVWCQVPPREILAHPRWDDSATETRGVFLPQTVCKEGDGGISIFFFFSFS